jgi:hypothetical protein
MKLRTCPAVGDPANLLVSHELLTDGLKPICFVSADTATFLRFCGIKTVGFTMRAPHNYARLKEILSHQPSKN